MQDGVSTLENCIITALPRPWWGNHFLNKKICMRGSQFFTIDSPKNDPVSQYYMASPYILADGPPPL